MFYMSDQVVKKDGVPRVSLLFEVLVCYHAITR